MVSSQIEHMKYIIVSNELLNSSSWQLVLQLMEDQDIRVVQKISRPGNTHFVEIDGGYLKEEGLYDITVVNYAKTETDGVHYVKHGLIITKS